LPLAFDWQSASDVKILMLFPPASQVVHIPPVLEQ
jgi:hypothetical protein